MWIRYGPGAHGSVNPTDPGRNIPADKIWIKRRSAFPSGKDSPVGFDSTLLTDFRSRFHKNGIFELSNENRSYDVKVSQSSMEWVLSMVDIDLEYFSWFWPKFWLYYLILGFKLRPRLSQSEKG